MARHGSTDDSLQNRLFSQLLRWYPEDYRWQYGPGMRQTFADRLREAQQQNETLGLAIFLVREFLSLAGGGIAHRTSDLAQDIRFTLRTLSREKSFTLTAVATLALGIGANTVIFSIVNGVLLHPLPYHDPDRLVRLHEVAPQGWGMGFSPPNLSSYQEQATLFEGMAAFRGTSLTLLTDDQAEKVPAMRVSAGFFGLLGISMSMGRTIVPEEDLDSAAPVVVLGDSIWRRLYGGKRNILGSTITLDGLTHTVVGIAPPELRFGSRPIDLWVPFAFDERDIEGRGRHFLEVIARLKPDIDVVAARAELESIAADLGQLHPETNTGWGILVLSLMDETVLGVRQPLLILFTAVVLVLLIACSNVANLLLARTQHRVAEMGTRAALGASRERLIRQTLTENIVLAAMGGVAALVLAYGGVKLIVSIAGRQLPRASEVSIDFSVLIFTFAVALGAGLFIGLAPAFSGTRLELMSVVKNPRSERVSRRRPSLRDLLVVTEIALSLILLVGAGLLIRSFWQLTHVESGLKPEGLLTASVALPEVQYQDNDRRAIFFSDLVKTIQQIPHITLASATTVLPFTGSHTTSVEIVSRDHEELKGVERRHVTPGFFETAEIPLLKGRTFSSSDDSASPLVMVVNQWFARRVFPGQNPIGQRIAWQGRSGRHLLEIVGVVGDIKDMGLDQDPRPTIYIHIRQTHAPSEMRLLVRTQGLPESAISDVRQVLRKFDPTLPLHQIATMQQVMSNTVSSQQFSTILLSLFAVIALLLAVVGIYGVMSHIVGLRRYEIGIRIAIGSKPEQIVRLIVRQGMVTAFVGISLGTALAFAAAHVLQGHLFEIEASDPRTFFGVTVLISFISLVACYLPARRAARIDPAQTLRLE